MSLEREVVFIRRIGHSIGKVWAEISDFEGFLDFIPGLETIAVDGRDVGAIRTVSMGGQMTRERLDVLDHGKHRLVYSVVPGGGTPWGMTAYSAEMHLAADGAGACVLTWTGRFAAPSEDAVHAIDRMLREFYGSFSDAVSAKLSRVN